MRKAFCCGTALIAASVLSVNSFNFEDTPPAMGFLGLRRSPEVP